MKKLKIIVISLLIIIIFTLALMFGMNNNQLVNFDYLIDSMQIKLSTLSLIMMSIGLLIGWVTIGFLYFRLKVKWAVLKRKFNKLQSNYEKQQIEVKKNKLLEL